MRPDGLRTTTRTAYKPRWAAAKHRRSLISWPVFSDGPAWVVSRHLWFGGGTPKPGVSRV